MSSSATKCKEGGEENNSDLSLGKDPKGARVAALDIEIYLFWGCNVATVAKFLLHLELLRFY